jgi:hypothetical protein
MFVNGGVGMSSKKKQGPLLYIHQPFTRPPSVKMQEVYKNNVLLEREHHKDLKVEEKVSEKVPIPIEVSKPENVQTQQPRSSFNRVKSFKEMNIRERLDYLINFPKVLPPVPCVFYTADENYQGYLVEYMEDRITIEFHDKNTKFLSVSELQDIIMIGIKK